MTFHVLPATATDRPPAFALLFHHLDPTDRDGRIANLQRLIDLGEIDPDGILAARDRHGLVGAMICQPIPGAAGLVWPPRSARGRDALAIEDQLIYYANAWLRARGAKLAQALLATADRPLAASLERNGYDHVTTLQYLRHDLELPATMLGAAEQLRFRPYDSEGAGAFHDVLMKTYEGTLDCPEVNGVRSLDEILAGHRAQGRPDSQRWWLALAGNQAVGVLMLTEMHDEQGWDLAYLGLIPEARGRRWGVELVRKALFEAKAAQALQLTLAVDLRNHPACRLYRELGFFAIDERDVFLQLFPQSAPGPARSDAS